MRNMSVYRLDGIYYVVIGNIKGTNNYCIMDEFGEVSVRDKSFIFGKYAVKYVGNLHENVSLVRLLKKQNFTN